jgi:D-alanyl-D-alanine-carboxypeptidase/D-alanyl-D-alanine-endopeptidase
MLLGGFLALPGCGGGSDAPSPPAPPAPASAWQPVINAIEAARPGFPNGLAVEVATTQGVVFSHSAGFANNTVVPIASASKWVSATVIMRLVDRGVMNLDAPLRTWLRDRSGAPWSGNLGNATLRHALSFTTGIDGDQANSDANDISLAEAVLRIYEGQAATAAPPGSVFSYGSTHLRMAARAAELVTGKSWAQIVADELTGPLGMTQTTVAGVVFQNNPNPAGSVNSNGLDYMRFMLFQLRRGLAGSTRLISQGAIDEQRREQWSSTTTIRNSPYLTQSGRDFHYGLGLWRECTTPANVVACDAGLRVSSTGAFGWAPWIDMQGNPAGNYAAVIMTRQPNNADNLPSETLKAQLDPLIKQVLATNPPVIRPVP